MAYVLILSIEIVYCIWSFNARYDSFEKVVLCYGEVLIGPYKVIKILTLKFSVYELSHIFYILSL